MASLSAHLRESGDHGRLGFHADCPVCREERLFGALSSESVVTRRARTALLTGVVAASLTTPPAVWGQELDSRQEGTAVPHEPGDGRGNEGAGGQESPVFDRGGDTDLPFEAEAPHGVTPDGGAYDDEGERGPLELEPEVDHDVPPIEPDDAPPAIGENDATAPEVPGAPGPQPPVTEPTPPAADAPQKPDARGRDSGREFAAKQRSRSNEGGAESDGPRLTPRAPEAPPPAASVAPNPSPPIQTAQAAPRTPAPPARSDTTPPPPPSDTSRTHVVQPGESLWLIAKRTLPPDASMARIAREVNRLWELNEDRIATGDPDLLRIGTKLALR